MERGVNGLACGRRPLLRAFRALSARRVQVPIGPYFADFACLEARLVVEVDDEHHGDQGYGILACGSDLTD